MSIETQSIKPSKDQTSNSVGADGGVSSEAVDLYECAQCQTKLGRHRFPKKIFRKLVLENSSSSSSNNNNNNNKEKKKKNEATEKNRNVGPGREPSHPHRAATERLVCHQCKRIETAKRCKQAPPKVLKHDNTRADSGRKRRPNNFGYCDYVDQLFGMDCFASHIAPLRVFSSAKDVSESMAAIQAVFRHGHIRYNDNDDDANDDGDADANANADADATTDRSSADESVSPPTNEEPPSSGILCLCIGDGCTPRTALLMAFLAKKRDRWECISIDPALSEDWADAGPGKTYAGAPKTTTTASLHAVRGLYGYKGTLKEFLGDPDRPPFQDVPDDTHHGPGLRRRRRWRHLVLVCVHSHARFVEEASIESIRYLYGSEKTRIGGIGVDGGADNNAAAAARTVVVLPPTTIVSLPCCPTFRHVRDIGVPPDLKYDDDCVFSACRSVEVWNLDEEEAEDSHDPERRPWCHPLGVGDQPLLYCSEDPTNLFVRPRPPTQ